MTALQVFFLVKEHGPRVYYLGNDYTYYDAEDMWTYNCLTYTKKSISYVEHLYGCLPKESNPLPVTDFHPEFDTSPLLTLDDHMKFHMILGMLQWIVTIRNPELCTVVSSLNQLGACPHQYHLEFSIRCFGYIKHTPKYQIAIDSRPLHLRV